MTGDDKARQPPTERSRQAWPDEMLPGPPVHEHKLPGVVRLGLAGLSIALLLLAVAVGLMAIYVYQANQYVQGRGDYRDAEAQRLEQEATERSRRSTCDLLDQLPATALLDRVRAKYQCGPGTPIAQLPPDVQAELDGDRPVPTQTSPPPGSTSSDAPPQAGQPKDSPPSSSPVASPPPPPPTSTPPPEPPDRGPLGEVLCAVPLLC